MKRTTAVRLIAAREVRERTKSRVFRIGTAMTVIIVLAAIVFPALARNVDQTPRHVVGMVFPVPQELQSAIVSLGPTLGADVVVQPFTSVGAGEDALRTDDIDILVVPGREIVTRVAVDFPTGDSTARLVSAVSDVVRLYAGLDNAGLDASRASEALNSPPPSLRGLEPAPRRNASDAAASGSGMILLFVFLTLYGAFILNGVIEEKTSRVVEILLSSVRPNELLLGKVVGIGIVGSIHGGVLVLAALVARAAVGGDSTSLTPRVVAYTLLWFVLGFGMYAWLYACAGALVSRSEDAQNLVFPLQIPLVASYGVGIVASLSGPNPVLNAMSFIPLTAPMTMLERMAARQVELWEVGLSIGLCLVTIYLVMKLAVTIFAGGILRSGQRVKLREAWRNPAS